MNWIQRKIYLYNVTFGLYMLDWWERYLFNTLIVVLMWFILYNTSKHVTDFCKRYVFMFLLCDRFLSLYLGLYNFGSINIGKSKILSKVEVNGRIIREMDYNI